MSDAIDPASLLLQRLQAPDGPWAAQVSELLISFALRIPATQLITPEQVIDLVTRALADSSVTVATTRHAKPAVHRQLDRARADASTVADLLPSDAVVTIERILQQTDGPRFAWLDGAVDPKLMAQFVAPIVQHVLLGFVTKLSGTLGGSSAGLIGMLGRGVQQRASALADVGKAMMGGIGVDVDKKLQSAAKDFSQSASSTIRDAVNTRMRSAEGQALVRQISTQIFARVRATKVHVIQDDFARLPIDEIIDTVPGILEHNREGVLVAKVIREEVSAALVAIGHQSIGDLLALHGLREPVETIARNIVPATLARFFADPETTIAVRKLLTPAPE
jgi:hypothetical protein